MSISSGSDPLPRSSTAEWSAVLSMAMCVAVLIASEFMPVSLLTPIATELGITEGQAGQAIAISGVFAVITSLFNATWTRRFDRRGVTMSYTALLILSGTIVALAPNHLVLMLGRALLGIAIGGFWSMSTATVMRLVPTEDVPKALAMLNGGNALAATVAAPLGSFLGSLVGWRGAFFCVVPLAAIALAWQHLALPAMPRATAKVSPADVFRLLGRPVLAFGMAAMLFLFMGQFALFTYLRPFLETVTEVDVPTLSLLLLLIGVAGLAGTWAIGMLLGRGLYGALILTPLAMAVVAVALVIFGQSLLGVAVLLGLWGLIATPAPVGWGTWLSRTAPEDADAGGGLMVATIQFAITLGATTGGYLFDRSGYESTFMASALLLCGATGLAALAWNSQRRR